MISQVMLLHQGTNLSLEEVVGWVSREWFHRL